MGGYHVRFFHQNYSHSHVALSLSFTTLNDMSSNYMGLTMIIMAETLIRFCPSEMQSLYFSYSINRFVFLDNFQNNCSMEVYDFA